MCDVYEICSRDVEEMHHFVANDLEEKLRLWSPENRKENKSSEIAYNITPAKVASMSRNITQIPEITPCILNDIETEAQYLANSMDNLIENLYNLLHSISSITTDNVEIHKNAVIKLTDNMDSNIKCMYTIMAKSEEMSKAMQPTERLSLKIQEVKRLVDILDAAV